MIVTGTPRIALTLGATTVQANYASGTGSSALVFTYTVQAGDLDADGIAVGALTLNSGTIQDAVGNNATLTLNSVGATTAVLVNGMAPSIASLSAPANATYTTGQALNFTVTFGAAVNVTGTPSFAVTVGSAARTATYVSGTGTTALTFRYTIVEGDNAAGGIAVASPITLNGGAIVGSSNSLAAALTFTPPTTTSILVSTAPVLTASGGPTAFTSGDNVASTPVAVDGALTVTDASSTTLASATIAITIGLQTAEDVLGFLNFNTTTYGNISGNYTAATGVLTLTSAGATATLAQWQAALRTVIYSNSAITPNTANRTVSWVVNDGVQNGNTVTKTVTVTAVNQTPVVTAGGGASGFVSASGVIAVDGAMAVSDRNNATLASATVAITGNFQTAEDNLAFSNSSAATFGNIAAGYNATTGVLTLTSAGATATLVQWQAALRAVTYNNTAGSPNTANRTVSFVVNDGTTPSAAATKTVTVTRLAEIASVTAPANGTYAAGQSLTFTITYNQTVLMSGVPSIAVTVGTAARAATYVSGHGTATLTFRYTVALGDNANGGISITSPIALNGGAITGSASVAAMLNFTPPTTTSVLVSTAPVLTAGGGNTAFTAGDNVGSTPVAVDGAIAVTDPSSATLASATVSITGGLQIAEDQLGFLNFNATTYGNITGNYTAATGVLTLSSAGATATLAQWQAALRAMVYYSSAIMPNTANRTLSLVVNDGVQNSNTVTKTVTVAAVNQTPLVTASSGSTMFFVGGSVSPVDSGLTVSDRNHATLASAQITISNFQSGAEAVLFTNVPATMGNIAGSYVTTGGVTALVLTSAGSTATLAQWQAALRSITYFANGAATTGDRTITFVVNDGTTNSAAGTKTVTVSPLATIIGVTAPAGGTYKAGDALNFTVTFGSAVTVTGTPSFVVTVGSTARTATYVSGTGTTALVFRYTVTLGDNAAGGIAVASPITLAGGTIAGAGSVAAVLTFTPPTTTTILVSTVPILAAGAGSTAFTAGDNVNSTPIAVDGALTVTDPSSATLASATVAITAGLQSAEDQLGFLNLNSTTFGNIAVSGSYSTINGVLTLTSAGATATLAQWQAALRAVVYYNSAITPNIANRTVSFTVSDSVPQTSNTITKTVTVTAVNQSPVVTAGSGASGFIATLGAIVIDRGVTLSDRNHATLASGTVSITGNFRSGEDVLAFTNSNATTFGNIAASYNAATGLLTLTSSGATATVGQWESALRATTYNNTGTSPNTTDRTISLVVNDSTTASAAAIKTVTVISSYATTTTLAAASATFGAASQTLALSAAVTSSGGTLNAGTVSFTIRNGSTVVGSAVTSGTVANGTASASYTLPAGTAAGTYTIQAAYSGAPLFDASAGTAALTISTASTTIAASAPSVTFGSAAQTVTLTANVTSSGSTVNGGTVTFTLKNSSGTTIGTAVTSGTVANGSATASYALPAGTASGSYAIQATYNAVGSFTTSSSSGTSLTIGVASTTTTVSGVFTTRTKVSTFLPYRQGEVGPFILTSDAAGNVYMIFYNTGDIGKVTPDGVVSMPIQGVTRGMGTGMACDASGNVYVVDYNSQLLKKITPSGTVSTFITSALNLPRSIAIDGFGNLYLASYGSGTINKITLSNGAMSPFVSLGLDRYANVSMACDPAGNLYVADDNSLTVRKVTPSGTVSAFATINVQGRIQSLVCDSRGNLFVLTGKTILKVTPGGIVSTFLYDQEWSITISMARDASNNLYLADFGSGNSAYGWSEKFGNPAILKIATAGVVSLSATVASAGGTVNVGTVTFTLLNADGGTVVGTPVTSGTVAAGATTVNYPLPPGTIATVYTIKAVYNPGSSFVTSTGSGMLTPTSNEYFQIFFGAFSNPGAAPRPGTPNRDAAQVASNLAAVLNPGGTTGKLVGYIASINAGFSVDIAINDDNTFTGQTRVLTSSTGRGQTLTFSGKTVKGVMTGTVVELGLSFTATIDPEAGSSAGSAGLYQATSLTAGGGTTYSVIGSQGQVFVLALTPGGVSAGTGTVASNGAYTVATDQGGSIAGSVNPTTGTTTATITAPDGSKVNVTGASAATLITRRLANLSLLGSTGGGQTITLGFVVSGPKTMLARAIGPSLSQFGVPGVQAAPTLTLFDGTGRTVLSNSGWAGDATLSAAFSRVGAFTLPPTSRDAALVATLPQSGSYTLQMTGGATAGRALAELYDLDPLGSPVNGTLINLSSLGPVAGTSTVMTAGFIIEGNTPRAVLIRGIGPSLAQFDVAGALAAPLLKLYDGAQTVIAQNQAWGTPVTVIGGQTPATASAITAAAAAAGAFPLATGSNDSSVVITLAPGAYSVHVSGVNSAAGTALIEIYELR